MSGTRLEEKTAAKKTGWAAIPTVKGSHWSAPFFGTLPQFCEPDGLGPSKATVRAGEIAAEHASGLSQFWVGGVGGTRCIVFTNAELIKQLHKHQHSLSRSKVLEGNFAVGFGGHNIFTVPSRAKDKINPEWRDQRKALSDELLSKRLTSYHQAPMVNIIRETFDNIDTKLADAKSEMTLNLESLCIQVTMLVAAKTLLGVPLEDKEFVKHTDDIAELFTSVLRASFNLKHEMLYRLNKVFKCGKTEIEKAREKLVEKIQDCFIDPYQKDILDSDNVLKKFLAQQPENAGKNPEDFTFDTDTIQDIISFMLLVGHDTTSRAVQFMLMYLAQNPELQEQVIEEINQLEKKESDVWSVGLADKLPILNSIFKEVERLHPGAPVLSYQVMKKITLDGGDLGELTLEKDSIALISLWNMQRSEKYFPKPLAFDHTRFLVPEEESKFSIKPNSKATQFSPFGVWERHCPAYKFAQLEALVVVVEFVRRYQFDLAKKIEQPFKCEMLGTLRHAGEVTMTIKPRAKDFGCQLSLA